MALDPKEFSAVVKVRAGKVYPDLVNSLALRNLPKETAEAEGWPTFYMPEPCSNGHTAARFCKNSLCVDCWRVRQGRDTIYPTAKNRTYYKQRDPAAAATANGAPVSAPAAPLPPEPKPAEQRLLAELAELRDIDKACAAVPGWSRGLVESRASSNPIFRDALRDLTDRLVIATRAPDAETFKWLPEIEKNFSRRYVDCGLIEQTRTELGISASDYHAHLAASPSFAALVSAAEPLARLTLRDRATAAAEKGNDRLLKILEIEAPESTANMSVTQLHAELEKMADRFRARGCLPNEMRHKVTGELINFDDLEYAQRDSSNADLVS
jgi:hypothetical protein